MKFQFWTHKTDVWLTLLYLSVCYNNRQMLRNPSYITVYGNLQSRVDGIWRPGAEKVFF